MRTTKVKTYDKSFTRKDGNIFNWSLTFPVWKKDGGGSVQVHGTVDSDKLVYWLNGSNRITEGWERSFGSMNSPRLGPLRKHTYTDPTSWNNVTDENFKLIGYTKAEIEEIVSDYLASSKVLTRVAAIEAQEEKDRLEKIERSRVWDLTREGQQILRNYVGFDYNGYKNSRRANLTKYNQWIDKYFDDKGFGFIRDGLNSWKNEYVTEDGKGIFFHVSNCLEDVGDSGAVAFDIEHTNKGIAAVNVEKFDTYRFNNIKEGFNRLITAYLSFLNEYEFDLSDPNEVIKFEGAKSTIRYDVNSDQVLRLAPTYGNASSRISNEILEKQENYIKLKQLIND